MKPTVEGQWKKFERWQRRFTAAATVAIAKMRRQDFVEEAEYLFLCSWPEFGGGLYDCQVMNEDELINRVQQKINFLRGYLVDISYDGAAFMAKHMGFLTLQYPRRCGGCMALWLEQDSEGSLEPGYHRLNAFDALVFLESLDQLDFASAHGSLPFDRIHIRNHHGQRWTKKAANDVARQIKKDLEFDALFCRVTLDVHNETLSLHFAWK